MAAVAPTRPSAAHPTSKAVASRQAAVVLLAPADEYFGPLKLSILGIRNTIRDLGARYDVNHDIGHQTFTSAQLTERAIHDWEHRYPHDDQVPKAIYLLQRLYTKVLTQEARDRAGATARWMFADYNASPQGRQLHKILAVEHLAPIDAAPSPTVTPVPAPVATSAYPPGSDSTTPAPGASAIPGSATAAPLVPPAATAATSAPTGTSAGAAGVPVAVPAAAPSASPT